MKVLCQYIYLIPTQCNQQCHDKHWFTYISHKWQMLWSNMPATLHMYVPLHINSTLLHIQVKQASQYAVDMHYVFDIHIYSLSSMTSYIFLVWPTWFIFCIYTNNLGNCIHDYNAHEVLKASVFYFVAIFLLSHLWALVYCMFHSHIYILKMLQSFYCNHKHFIFGSHICPLRNVIMLWLCNIM